MDTFQFFNEYLPKKIAEDPDLADLDAVYQFDVLTDHCAGDAACPQALTDFQWFTNFRDGVDTTAIGECPCSDAPGPGENQCTDNSRVYMVRLFRNAGSPLTCEPYEIEFSNGLYRRRSSAPPAPPAPLPARPRWTSSATACDARLRRRRAPSPES